MLQQIICTIKIRRAPQDMII